MAGGYQTTGENAKRGTGVWPDTGGGWVNGRCDDTMVMLKGYAHMIDLFTSLEWRKLNPDDSLVSSGNFCLADPGRTYVVYLPKGGESEVKLAPGRYHASWLNPRSGEKIDVPDADGLTWRSPTAPDREDWVVLLALH